MLSGSAPASATPPSTATPTPGRSGSRSSHRKHTVSAAIAQPSASERGEPIAVIGHTTSVSRTASAKNWKPRPSRRREPAADAVAELVPVPGREQLRVEPGDERGEGQPGERGEQGGGDAQPLRQRGGRRDGLAGQDGGEHPRDGI